MELILITFFCVPIILWLLSIYLLSDWKKFNLFFVINAILVITYLSYLPQENLNDPYGLGNLIFIIEVLFTHVLVVFVFALFREKITLYFKF